MAKIFCLIHKMDLVPESQREAVSLILKRSVLYKRFKNIFFDIDL